MKPSSKEMLQKLTSVGEAMKAKLDEAEDQDDLSSEADIGIRIARVSLLIAKGATKASAEQMNQISVAMGLLAQAQAVVDKDKGLALRLMNRARAIPRKG